MQAGGRRFDPGTLHRITKPNPARAEWAESVSWLRNGYTRRRERPISDRRALPPIARLAADSEDVQQPPLAAALQRSEDGVRLAPLYSEPVIA